VRACGAGAKSRIRQVLPRVWLDDMAAGLIDDMFQQAHVKRVAVACTLLKAEVVEYPGGMPGDIGFFLTWK
jgi:hypothetical protein